MKLNKKMKKRLLIFSIVGVAVIAIGIGAIVLSKNNEETPSEVTDKEDEKTKEPVAKVKVIDLDLMP